MMENQQNAQEAPIIRPIGIGPTVLITGAERGIGLALVASLVDVEEVTHIFAACYCLDKEKFETDLAMQRQKLDDFAQGESGDQRRNNNAYGGVHRQASSAVQRMISTASPTNSELSDDLISYGYHSDDEATAGQPPCLIIELQKHGADGGVVKVELISLDVTDDKSIERAFQQVQRSLARESLDGLNMLINNAGILDVPTNSNKDGRGFNPLSPDRDVYLRHFNVNTVGTVLVTAKFLPLLKNANIANGGDSLAKKSAVIFITSSVASTNNFLGKRAHNNVAYAMSKNALNHYMRAMADPEYAGEDIISVCISPGWTSTAMGSSYGGLTAEQRRSSVEHSVTKMVRRFRRLNTDDSGKFFSELTMPLYEYGTPYNF